MKNHAFPCNEYVLSFFKNMKLFDDTTMITENNVKCKVYFLLGLKMELRKCLRKIYILLLIGSIDSGSLSKGVHHKKMFLEELL